MQPHLLNYATVASGIEAPTIAWKDLPMNPVWFSQFDPEHDYTKGLDFPSHLLKHYYPHIPNLGDMLKLHENEIYQKSSIDLLCGGTPCQDFSIAGAGTGLDGDRGKLTIQYGRIIHQKKPGWFLWENVPNSLATNKGRDFAAIIECFTGLRGITPPADGWPKAGIFEGPLYSISYRILNSEYFGLPQHRNRLFIVGHIGTDWRPSTAVLFNRNSGERYIETGRKERKEVAGALTTGVRQRNSENKNLIGMTTGQAGAEIMENISPALTCNHEAPILFENYSYNINTITSKVNKSNPREGIAPTLTSQQNPHILVQQQQHIFKIRSGKEGGGKGYLGNSEKAYTLTTNNDQYLFQEDRSIVRRLTPLEYERLQGFPDNYTAISFKGRKIARDTYRYKACGNSMPVPVIKWIGERICYVQSLLLKK